MSDKAETKECVDCSGRGFRGVGGGLCPTCAGTGVWTTGEVAGALEPLHGMAFNLEDARGHIKRLSEQNDALLQQVDEQQETIAAQAAEIERLKAEAESNEAGCTHNFNLSQQRRVEIAALKAERDSQAAEIVLEFLDFEAINTLKAALEISVDRRESQRTLIEFREEESRSHGAALLEVTTDRDQLRLEVQKLKDDRHEAADVYAAIEAERDALKTERDALQLHLDAERSRPLRRIAEQQVKDFTAGLDAANARAESYLRVIEAKERQLDQMARLHNANLAMLVAKVDAGLPFRVGASPIVPPTLSSKDADHD